MKHLIEFPLEDGGNIVVEVNEAKELGGTERAGRDAEEGSERASQTFEQALSKLRPAAEKVIVVLRELVHRPDELEMEFGFNMHAEAGIIIAATSTEANYKVTLRWSGESKNTGNKA